MSLNLLGATLNSKMSAELTFQGDGTTTQFKVDLAKWPVGNLSDVANGVGINFGSALPSGVSLTLGAHPSGYTTTLSGSLDGSILTITFGTAPPATGGTVAVEVQLLYSGLQ